jgi:hypothetical protein
MLWSTAGGAFDNDGLMLNSGKPGAAAAQVRRQAEPILPMSPGERGSRSAGRSGITSEDSSSKAHRKSTPRKAHERPALGSRRTEGPQTSGESSRETKRTSDGAARESQRLQSSARGRDDAEGRLHAFQPVPDGGEVGRGLVEDPGRAPEPQPGPGTQGANQKRGLEHGVADRYIGDPDENDGATRERLVSRTEGISPAKSSRVGDKEKVEANVVSAVDVVEDEDSRKEKKRKHKKEKKEKKERKKKSRREQEGGSLVPQSVER